LGIGDWGLGIGDWPNPQSPIPNPQSPGDKRSVKVINKIFHLYKKNKSQDNKKR